MTTDTTETQATPKRRRRIFLWFFLAVQVLFIIWIATGANSAQSGSCDGLSASDCQDAKDVGTTIGIGLIIFFWAAVDVVLGGGYAVVRLARRK